MAFCRYCGNEIKEGSQFCTKCGAPTAAQQPQQPQQAVSAATPEEDVRTGRPIAWLAYLGLLLLIPLFVKKESKYCQFHVRQGVILFAITLVYEIIGFIIAFFGVVIGVLVSRGGFYSTIPFLVAVLIIALIFEAGMIFLAVIEIIGIVNAATGKEKKLPLLGKITLLDKLMDKIYKV